VKIIEKVKPNMEVEKQLDEMKRKYEYYKKQYQIEQQEKTLKVKELSILST
jgi:uncharacterized protein YeaO (DUF488 family)